MFVNRWGRRSEYFTHDRGIKRREHPFMVERSFRGNLRGFIFTKTVVDTWRYQRRWWNQLQ